MRDREPGMLPRAQRLEVEGAERDGAGDRHGTDQGEAGVPGVTAVKLSSAMTTFAAAMARREARAVRLVRRVAIVVACLYVVSFSWSIYRRIEQIMRIEPTASSFVLVPGSTVGYDVVASGEVHNRIRLELVQGARSLVLLEQRASVNGVSGLDPRVFRYTPTLTVTPALLAHFHPGPATLRVTGYGGMKLLRTPAPRVRQLEVRLQP
jgi:hypothetical protein